MTRLVASLGLLLPSMLWGQSRQPIDLQKYPFGDGTIHLTQSQTQAAVARVAQAVCKQVFPVDTSLAQYNCLVAMRDALQPPVTYGECSGRPRKSANGGMECWRQDLTTKAWDWFPTDSTLKSPH
ncbi:MAG TPA: hypothetical protein VKB45_13385 [Gemmatimonadales bacterium]|nr:hypothetical protein [Gemmatimonadales bacterium]